MIKVTKDKDVKLITKGAYESIYKPLGYTIVKPEAKKVSKTASKIVEKKKEDNEGIQTTTKTSNLELTSKGDDLE